MSVRFMLTEIVGVVIQPKCRTDQSIEKTNLTARNPVSTTCASGQYLDITEGQLMTAYGSVA